MQVKLQLRKRPGEAWRKIRRTLHWVFLSLGLAALGYCVLFYFQGVLYQAYETREFESLMKSLEPAPSSTNQPSTSQPVITPKSEHTADGVVPKVHRIVKSKRNSIARMQVPRLGLSVMVIEGVDESRLNLGAGHVPGTALPGQPGNVAIAGHRDTFFRKLRDLQKDDTIELATPSGSYNYSVESMQIVDPSDVEVLRPSSEPRLTLVTCYPFVYIGPAPRRFIVQARQIVAKSQGKGRPSSQ